MSSVLKLEYVEDAPRSGRPPKLNPELEDTIVASFVGEGIRDGEEKVTKAQVAEATGVSTTTIRRVLASRGIVFEQKPGSHAMEDGTWKVVAKKVKTPKGKGKETQIPNMPTPNTNNFDGNDKMEDSRAQTVDEFGGRLDPLLSAEPRPGAVL